MKTILRILLVMAISLCAFTVFAGSARSPNDKEQASFQTAKAVGVSHSYSAAFVERVAVYTFTAERDHALKAAAGDFKDTVSFGLAGTQKTVDCTLARIFYDLPPEATPFTGFDKPARGKI